MSCRFTPQLSVNDQLESGKQPVRLQWLFEQMLSSKWPLILQTCWWIKDHQIQWYSIVLRLSRNRTLPCSGLTVSGKKSYSSCNASHFIFFPYRFIVCISSVKNPNGIYHTWVCCQKKKCLSEFCSTTVRVWRGLESENLYWNALNDTRRTISYSVKRFPLKLSGCQKSVMKCKIPHCPNWLQNVFLVITTKYRL